MNSALTLLPLGGLGEIGMNGLVLTWKGRRWLIDCGAMFDDEMWSDADLVLPDLGWLAQQKNSFAGMILTHGHEDHIGAVPFVQKVAPMPVYASPFTHSLINRKLEEHGLSGQVDQRILEPNMSRNGTPGVRPPETPELGFSFIRVTHSIPDAASLVIDTPAGTILHTADFKIDKQPMDGEDFDTAAFKQLGDQGLLLLLSDSTNAQVPGWTHSEQVVLEELERQISAWPGRVLATQFASNIHRLRCFEQVAERTGRRLCLIGRSLHVYSDLARESGLKSIDPSRLIDMSHINDVPPEELIVVMTGSQGERRSALYRASTGHHPFLKIVEGDLILWSARFIPGNERHIWRIINNLSQMGAKVVHPMAARIHTSGHARQDELREMLSLTRPQHFIPVHGEYAFLLEHERLAKEIGIQSTTVIKNGQEVAVDKDGIRLINEHALKNYYYDGTVTADAHDHAFVERKKTFYNGFVAAHLTVDRGKKGLAARINLQSRGVYTNNGTLLDQAADALREALLVIARDASEAELEDLSALIIRRFFKRATGKKPVVVTFVNDS